jgi:hypothetical protein
LTKKELIVKKYGFLLLLFGLLAACGADEPPLPVTIADACQQEEFTRVTAEGYLRLFTLGSTICRGEKCDLAFYAQPDGQGDLMTARVDADAQPDSGQNAIEMPPQAYQLEDLRIHTHNGAVVGQETPVKLTGYIKTEADRCYLSVTVIETS